MAESVAGPSGRGRALTGAVLLDLAVSPLFAWDVFTDDIRRDLDVPPAALTAVFSTALVAFVLGVLGGGRLADTVPARRLTLATTGATVAGLAGSGVATSPGILFLTFGVLLGGGSGLGYVTAVRVAATAGGGRGLALGVVVSAYAIGGAVLAPVASSLLQAVGRRATFTLLAGVLGVLLLVAATLVPRARPATGSRVLGARERPRSPRPSARVVVVLGLTLGLGSAPALAAFAHAGVLVGDAVPVAAAVALLNLGNVAGRLLAGQAADRIGHRPALHGAAILSVAGCLPLADGRTGSAALVAVGVLGTAYGAFSTLVPTATADVVPADRFGTAYGRVFTGWGVAGLLAPTGSTALADASDYGPAYQVLLGAALLTWLCIAVLGRLARPAAPR